MSELTKEKREVIHEINNLLTVISGMSLGCENILKLLQTETSAEKIEQALSKIQKANAALPRLNSAVARLIQMENGVKSVS